jgi:hypothetical protein
VRKQIAFAVLSLVLLAGVVVGREKPAEVLLQEKASRQVDFDLSRLEKRATDAPAGDPFAPRSFGAPEAPVAAAQPKPEAPPMPFRYMGKVVDNGELEILLLRGDEHFVVRPGQKIDAEYRLDKATKSALTITYLPMKTRQTLEITP